MSTKPLLPAQLLTCSDDDFNNNVKNMSAKCLMDLIAVLQQEMESEQEHFNSLTTNLHGLHDRNSRQHKTISNDMVASQVRLTTLMNRSMKCFSQQNLYQNKQGGQLQIQTAKSGDLLHPSCIKSTKSIADQPCNADSGESCSKTAASTLCPASSVCLSVNHGDTSQVDLVDSHIAIQQHTVSARDINGELDSSTRVPRNCEIPISSSQSVSALSQSIHLKPTLIGSDLPMSNKSQLVKFSVASTSSVPNLAVSIGQNIYQGLPSVKQLALTFGGKSIKPTGHGATLSRYKPLMQAQTTMPMTVASTKSNQSEVQLVHARRQDLHNTPSFSGKYAPLVSGLKHHIVTDSSSLLTNLDRKKSSSSIVLTSRHGKQNTSQFKSSLEISMASGGMHRVQSHEKLFTSDSLACTPKEIPVKHSKQDATKTMICKEDSLGGKRSTVAQKESSMSRQQLQQDNSDGMACIPASAVLCSLGSAKLPTVDIVASQTSDAAGSSHTGSIAEETKNVPRINFKDWDPKPVLEQLYKIQLMTETAEDISHQFISMEGLMEKLPMNKKKSTLLKTWKRRFFQAKDGWLQYYETSSREKPSEIVQLMGGHIDDMGNRILGIDDGRGHYLMVRAPTEKEYGQWKVALESQTADNTRATYVRPVVHSPQHPSMHVVVVDLGSSAVRAGILGQQISLPQIIFPSVVAVHKATGEKVVGMDAYQPNIRHNSNLFYPVQPSGKIEQFNINVELMSAIFRKIFSDLNINPSNYMVMLSTPQKLSDSLRAALMDSLIDDVGVQGVCMVQQSLLALYSYHTTSGIIVDIGNRIEILPIYDGFIIESGVSRCPYGSQKVVDSLKKSLLENNYKFSSDAELLLVRYLMEQVCYVARNFKEEERLCSSEPGKLQRCVNLTKFSLPEGTYKNVQVEEGRFKSPEGFFNADLWEMDYPTLHKLIYQAIQSCPMDNRRHMYRAVYLSGGVTMLPGFVDRLEYELSRLAPSAVKVEVHASPHRNHAAYLGACCLASMPQFQDMAISWNEWRKERVKAFAKWQIPSF